MTTYICTRTSSCYDEKPCEEAYQVYRVQVDERNVDDPKKVPLYKGESAWWYTVGTNHRVENGHIKRDMEVEQLWAVDVKDLSEFVKKYGKCVVGIGDRDELCLEIYDE